MSQPQQPPQMPPQGPPQMPLQRPPMMPPPLVNPPLPKIPTEKEKNEGRRTIIYSLIFIVATLIVGFLAGVVDQALHSNSVDRNQNFFILNAQDILLIIASCAPWAILFFLICVAWVYTVNRLFISWNSSLAHGEDDESYGKGVIYEITKDNNAAAALLLVMPLLVIAVALIFIVLLIKQ